METLTVIVPFYNEEKFLEQSVNRLLNYNIFVKILLIDNNSTDDSFNIAQKLVNTNKNIELYKTDKNKGKGVALSHAKQFITTTHVVIHDADLEYFPEDISEMFEVSLKYNRSVKEVPIKYEGRSYSEGKKIKTSDGLKYLLNTLKYRFIN